MTALRLAGSGTADGNGDVRIQFPSVPATSQYNVSFVATNADAGMTWALSVGNTQLGSTLGGNPFGPFTLLPGETLSASAQGTGGKSYSASLLGGDGLPGSLPAVAPNGSGSVTEIGGTPNVNIGNTPTVLVGGTPNVNIGNTPSVIISGTPTVNLSANQVVQVQNTAGGSLTVAGSVNIGNTPSVIISGTPTVNLSANQVVQVENSSGGSLTVAGSVNIGNTPNVTLSGTPDVNIANTPAVSISGGVTIDEITAGTVNVQNVPNSSLETLSSARHLERITDVVNNTQYNISGIIPSDRALVLAASGGGTAKNQLDWVLVNSAVGVQSGIQYCNRAAMATVNYFAVLPIMGATDSEITLWLDISGVTGGPNLDIFAVPFVPPQPIKPMGSCDGSAFTQLAANASISYTSGLNYNNPNGSSYTGNEVYRVKKLIRRMSNAGGGPMNHTQGWVNPIIGGTSGLLQQILGAFTLEETVDFSGELLLVAPTSATSGLLNGEIQNVGGSAQYVVAGSTLILEQWN